jgi:hypothetical protein
MKRLVVAEEEAVKMILFECLWWHHDDSNSIIPPYSYILKSLALFIAFMRENVRSDGDSPMSDFMSGLREYWKMTFGMLLGRDRLIRV